VRRTVVLAFAALVVACTARPAPSPALSPTPSPSPTATASPSPSPSPSPTPSIAASSIKFGLVVADPSATTFRLRLEGGADPPPAYTAARIVNFATNQVSEVKRLTAARFFPLAWRVASHVVSGVDAGEGGVHAIYRFKEDGSSAGDTPPDQRFSEVVDTSRDDTAILGQFAYFQAGKSFSGIRMVASDDPRPLAEREAPAGAFLIRARFRAGTSDVVALIRDGTPSRYALEIWPTGIGVAAKRVWTGTTATAASGELLVRFDGRIAYVRTDESGSGIGSWQMVDLDSGTSLQLAAGASAVPRGPSFLVTDDAVAKLKKP
jgi:hypothetical protein